MTVRHVVGISKYMNTTCSVHSVIYMYIFLVLTIYY